MKMVKLLEKIWVVGLLTPALAFAQMGVEHVDQYEVQTSRCLPCVIMTVINWTLTLVGVLALGFIVYGGFLYITSHGDSSQVDTAKTTIINAVIGIVIIGVAAALVNFVVSTVAGG